MPSSGPTEPESHEEPQGDMPAHDGQRIKLAQQGELDTERSLTQLGKDDVTLGPQETAWHDKPQGVCCVIRPQHIEIYAKPMPVVSEWFNPGTEHYWHTNFVVPRGQLDDRLVSGVGPGQDSMAPTAIGEPHRRRGKSPD